MANEHRARNTGGLVRLHHLIGRLTEADLIQPIATDGWSVTAVLAHLAFWDRWTIARWDRFDRDGAFEEIPDTLWDMVNAAALKQWAALPPSLAAQQAVEAAERAAARIAQVSPEGAEAAAGTSRLFMLDRTVHWYPHLDEIEAAVTSKSSRTY